MPPVLILLVMSLVVASHAPRNATRIARDAPRAGKEVPAQTPGNAALDALGTAKTRDAKAADAKTPDAKAPVVEIADAEVTLLPPMPVGTNPQTTAAIVRLDNVTRGMQMPSETDAPMRVVYWASEKSALLPADVANSVEQEANAPLEIRTIDEFFANAATVENWMNDDEKATARRFGKLIETLHAELENPQVYLFGKNEKTVVIIGKVKGGFGGIVTLVVET